ncbi:hypothetical protein [Streptosporangium vulgare]|uniref:hypothetical protein n=1 Tax=Streptosporangium vulgare TaxID=46190 RepID=UPI003CD059B9
MQARAHRDGDAARHRQGHRRSRPNYDGRSRSPLVLPSRFPNLLVNGRRASRSAWHQHPAAQPAEVAGGIVWCLQNPEADDEELLEALIAPSRGPTSPPAR